MSDEKIINLISALVSHIGYCNYLEEYGHEKTIFEKTNFELLQVIYGGFALTFLMDKYFDKNKVIKSDAHAKIIKQLVNILSTKNEYGYSLGNLSYHDEYTLLEKVRNKLAHGDFVIRDNDIVFEEHNIEGKIDIDKFLYFINILENLSEDYESSKPYTRFLFKCDDLTKIRHIKTEKDFDFACNRMYAIKIIDQPSLLRVRNQQYFALREQFYDYMEKIVFEVNHDGIEKILKYCEPEMKKMGINIKYSITRISELSIYKTLKEKYFEETNEYYKASGNTQINVITSMVSRLNKGQFQDFNMLKGIILNLNVLSTLKKHPDYIFSEVLMKNFDFKNLYIYHIDDLVLSTFLVGFNSIFEYGLEKGISNKGNNNLINLFEGKELDFSMLQIEKLYDENMLLEYDFEKFEHDFATYYSKNLCKINSLIKKEQRTLDNYLKNCKNVEEERTNRLKQNIEKAIKDREIFLQQIEDILNFVRQFDIKRYTINFNIITHIRNAIAHGNVYVDSYSKNIYDTEIIIRDYLDNKIVYEKKLKIIEFSTLFSIINIDLIYRCMLNNLDNKSKIDIESLNKVLKRKWTKN